MFLEFRLWVENTITQSIKTDPKVAEAYQKQQNDPIWNHFKNINPAVLIALRKWVAYQSTYTDPHIAVKLMDKHVLFDPEDRYNLKQKLNRIDYNLQNLETDNQIYHNALAKTQSRTYSDPVKPLGLPPINGLEWVSLEKAYCQTYGNTMGHCGNAAWKPSDNILSLMDPKTNMHYLTFIVNKGVLGESKSQKNQKPQQKFHPNIKQLLLSPYIKVIKGLGYKPENNFQFSDLDPQDQQEILAVKPHIDNYVGHINAGNAKFPQDLQKPWHKEEEHFIFDKNISNEEFINLADDLSITADNKTPELVSIAGEYRRRGLPLKDNVYKRILSSPFSSYYYTVSYLNPKDTPPELLNSIARDGNYSASYGAEILKGKNVPKVIMDTIISQSLGTYVYMLMAHKHAVPPDVMNHLKQNENDQVEFYSAWKESGEDMPEEGYQALSPTAALRILDIEKQGGQNIDKRLSAMIINAEPDDLASYIANDYNYWNDPASEEIALRVLDSQHPAGVYRAVLTLANYGKLTPELINKAINPISGSSIVSRDMINYLNKQGWGNLIDDRLFNSVIEDDHSLGKFVISSLRNGHPIPNLIWAALPKARQSVIGDIVEEIGSRPDKTKKEDMIKILNMLTDPRFEQEKKKLKSTIWSAV